MDITDVVLDTNTLYRPKELREIAARGQPRLWGSVANVIEIVGDIEDPQKFSEARSQLRTLEDATPGRGYLPDPDTVFKADLGLDVSFEDAMQWKEYVVKPIVAAERMDDLELNLDLHRQRRREHAEEFDAGVREMIKSINPDAAFEGDEWKVNLKGDALNTFIAWLWSPEGKHNLVAAWFSRQGWSGLTMPKEVWAKAFVVLDPYYRAYRGYVAEIVRRNIKHQKNDALDFDFVLPLWRPGWVFLTQEKRVKQFLRTGELEEAKFMTVDELMAKLSSGG